MTDDLELKIERLKQERNYHHKIHRQLLKRVRALSSRNYRQAQLMKRAKIELGLIRNQCNEEKIFDLIGEVQALLDMHTTSDSNENN